MAERKSRPRFGSRRVDRILVVVSIASVLILAAGIYGAVQAVESSGPDILAYRLAFAERGADNTSQLRLINRDGSIDPLTDGKSLDIQPAWSRDGKRLAFARNGSIWVRDGDGTRVLVESATASSPQWSPAGTKIAFSDLVSGTSQNGFIWIMDGDGGNKHLLFDPNGANPPPDNCFGGFVAGWYPAGDRILYRGSYPDGSIAICSVKTDGSDVQTIVHDPAGKALNYSPALSPDGTQLAFVSNRDGSNRIYVAKADGSTASVFLIETGKEDYPAWSPDGQWLAFASDQEGQTYHLYMAHPDGSGITRLTSGALAGVQPAWAASEQ